MWFAQPVKGDNVVKKCTGDSQLCAMALYSYIHPKYLLQTSLKAVNVDHFYTALKDHFACYFFIYSGGFVMLSEVLRDLENAWINWTQPKWSGPQHIKVIVKTLTPMNFPFSGSSLLTLYTQNCKDFSEKVGEKSVDHIKNCGKNRCSCE